MSPVYSPGYVLESPGVRIPVAAQKILLQNRPEPRPALGPIQPPNEWAPG
jgi:hypothetical protein